MILYKPPEQDVEVPFFSEDKGIPGFSCSPRVFRMGDTTSRAMGLQVCVVPSLPQPAVSTEPWTQGCKGTATLTALHVTDGFFCNITAELSGARPWKASNT